ncbi:IS1595 family transposase [Candidatus Absconditicoccus praedator]|uniref:IS1595 family transposase n=1 Tax=Candidatus Absconditicoccus praedator TaxID=2735562 RepID=UPI001E465F74|nr:IS1595 family transposase [Candidatus Absconditicoccus praedator]UFX82921.1 IS1595 family transposase [Candidatus Absconditicoccus praedator]
MKCFSVDLTETQTSKLLGISRKTINRFYKIFREIIYEYQCNLFEELKMKGDIEMDESYFGAKRIRGFKGKLKRGRGTRKQPVFGIMKRNGEIYIEIIPKCSSKILEEIILDKVDKESSVHSDYWKGYDGLVDVGYYKHYRVKHGDNEFGKGGGVHINGMENFWGFTKRRLSKFNGFKVNFEAHLKECEFIYGKTELEIEKKMIKLIKIYFK